MTRITAGKNASSELKAICCASPMPPSARNALPVRFRTSSHSPARSRSGDVTLSSVAAVEEGKARTLLRPRGLPPENAPGRGAEHEARSGRSDGQDRQLAAGGVRPLAQRLDGFAEAFALGFELAPDLLGRPIGHRASAPRLSGGPLRSLPSEREASLRGASGAPTRPATRSWPARRRRRSAVRPRPGRPARAPRPR